MKIFTLVIAGFGVILFTFLIINLLFPSQQGLSNTNSEDEYILYGPLKSKEVFLVRKSDKEIVHTWTTNYEPGMHTLLLENGNLLRTGRIENEDFGYRAGMGGILQEIAPDGKVLWEFKYSDDKVLAHHNIEVMPSGNILLIAWEKISYEEAIENGKDPDRVKKDTGLLVDKIVELKPLDNGDTEIVKTWRIMDHLIQDFDNSKLNYGDITIDRLKMDINFPLTSKADWNHTNAVDYNEELEQIMISMNGQHEILVIDWSENNKGILGRYGNPASYKSEEPKLFWGLHDVEWVENGFPGEGNLLVFNNGAGRSGENKSYSSVEEYRFIDEFTLEKVWEYSTGDQKTFFSAKISGAERLKSGNTMICEGDSGTIFEVNPDGEVVWSLQNERFDPKYSDPERNQRRENSNFMFDNGAVFNIEVYYPTDSQIVNLFTRI